MQRHHDMGGLEAGPIERAEHDHEPWEKRVDAILRLLADRSRRVITVDELRRNIEELGPGAYDEMSYYQRWMASIGNNLLEKGVIGVDEVGRINLPNPSASHLLFTDLDRMIGEPFEHLCEGDSLTVGRSSNRGSHRPRSIASSAFRLSTSR
ncbi:MAG: nitrile hydratase subunit beta [Rhizobiales bacterium]|nr:nitrile hydratase subunit beta [Hyphomicrobiales bacterium]